MARKRSSLYVLIGQTPVPEPDVLVWAEYFEQDRVVKQTEIPGGIVSTVFLGVDHNWSGGPPLLFETMVFMDGGHVVGCRRCATWAEAEAQHERILAERTTKR